jgi:hypothetical protein
MNKWPRRSYRVRQSTLTVKCAKCEGAGKRFLQRVGDSGLQRCIHEQDSNVASTSKTASGAATFSIDTVEQSPGGGALVVGETGKVIQRNPN